MRKGEDAAYNVIGLFLKHAIDHQGCYMSLGVLWRLMCREEGVATVLRKEYFDAVVRMLETIWQQLEESKSIKFLERIRNKPID